MAQPERVKIKIIKKKKIVIENNDIAKNIPEKPIETEPIASEKLGEPLPEVREIVKIKIPKRKVKAISTIPIAEFNINSTKIIDRLPKKTEKIIYKASSYYMNNRKISIEKLNKLFQPYRKEILDNNFILSEMKLASLLGENVQYTYNGETNGIEALDDKWVYDHKQFDFWWNRSDTATYDLINDPVKKTIYTGKINWQELNLDWQTEDEFMKKIKTSKHEAKIIKPKKFQIKVLDGKNGNR